MGSNFAPNPGTPIDATARPAWRRTAHKHFPFAAYQDRCWWVLRLNFGFPEHDMYTLFIDDLAVADITADANHTMPLLASIGALRLADPDPSIPVLDAGTAGEVARNLAAYANYGSEHGDPCLFCSSDS